MSSWIQHVKDVQAKHGVSYKEAMSMAKGSYHKGSASKTRPGDEDFMAHKGTKSKTRPGHIDYEGGAVGDIAFAPSSVPAFGNTNLGVMRVPQAHIPFQVVNASGQTKRPRMRGTGVINELGNQNYIAQVYNQKDLGANGVVRL